MPWRWRSRRKSNGDEAVGRLRSSSIMIREMRRYRHRSNRAEPQSSYGSVN